MHILKQYCHSITIPPLLPMLIFFIAGIIWQAFNVPIVLIIITFTCIISYFFYQQVSFSHLSKTAIVFSIAASGAWLYEKDIINYNNFYLFVDNQPINVIGTIEDINKTIVNKKKVTIVTIKTISAQKNKIIKKINKSILIYAKYIHDIQAGDTIFLQDIVCKKPNNDQLIHYQIRENILAILFNDTPVLTVINRPSWSIKNFIFNQKQKILHYSKKKLSPQTFSFFSSLFLGNRSYVKTSIEDTNEHFKQWGIFHFLARSGLHLALFITVWQYILQYIPISFYIKNALLIFLSCLYALLSWSSIPFTRSLMLFTLNKICLFTKKSYNLLHYLTLVCFCFLLHCPSYLFFLDFQLTFGITFALAWFNQLHAQCLYEQYRTKQLNY